MSSSEQQLRMWMLQWRKRQGARGRRHAAIFILNAEYNHVDPGSGSQCLGTLYHVQGSPMSGFFLEIRRNFDDTSTNGINAAILVAVVERRHVWQPPTNTYVSDDSERRSEVDSCAMFVRTPGICRRPWIAVCTSAIESTYSECS